METVVYTLSLLEYFILALDQDPEATDLEP